MRWGLGDVFALDSLETGPLQTPQPASMQTLQALYPGRGQQAAIRSAASPARPSRPVRVRYYRYGCQFAQPGPVAGLYDQDFEHDFDAITTPAFGSTVAAGASLRDIPLVLETDAEFVVRGIRIFTTATVFLDFQLKEPGGKFAHSFLSGGLAVAPVGALAFNTIPIEPEIVCPKGGVWMLYVANPTATPVVLGLGVTFFGVKRRSNAC